MRKALTEFLNSIRLKRQHIVLLLLVSFAFVVVAVMAVVLTALQTVAVTANALDESRSQQAVSGALSTIKSQMAATMVDYTVWDAAAEAVYSADADSWVLDNFDLANGDSEIFDTAYLLGPDGEVRMGFRKGLPFSTPPAEFLSPAFDELTKRVRSAGVGKGAEAVGFVKTQDGIAVVGVSTIRGASPNVAVPRDRLQELVFVSHLDQAKIDSIAETYLIPGLKLIDAVSVPTGAALIADPTGRPIAALTWTAQAPGDVSYHRVRPYVLVAIAIVGVFILLLVLAGSVVIGRLRGDEIAARKMALTDRLSGLLNRLGLFSGLQDMIGQAAERRDDVMLFYLDMDGFKEVNDVYGHATGDMLIKSVAAGLTHLIPAEAILARLGGDEFAIALPVRCGEQPAVPLASLILDFFSEPFTIGERVVSVGISVGTAVSPLGAIDAEELLRRADIAMYKAKTEGRGRCMAHDAEMDAVLAERTSMELALRAGLRDNEFFVVYQPVVDARTYEIVAVEALLRWHSSQMGVVSPETFIPLAESSGLIDKLGQFVMEEALKISRQWPQIGVSINVSPAQFRNPFFIPVVKRLLAESGVSPQSVTLEVTEGYFIHNEAAHETKVTQTLDKVTVGEAVNIRN